jgi:hypothetical protein
MLNKSRLHRRRGLDEGRRQKKETQETAHTQYTAVPNPRQEPSGGQPVIPRPCGVHSPSYVLLLFYFFFFWSLLWLLVARQWARHGARHGANGRFVNELEAAMVCGTRNPCPPGQRHPFRPLAQVLRAMRPRTKRRAPGEKLSQVFPHQCQNHSREESQKEKGSA